MAPPDFSNRTLFPSFTTCPETDSPSPTDEDEDWFLLGQVKDDMTLSKPTLVLSDRDGAPFALVFDGLDRGALDFKRMGLRKGCTAVVPRARRTVPTEEGKRGFVRVGKGAAGDVRGIPAELATVLEVAMRMRMGEGEGGCGTCGKVEGEGEGGKLLRCTGCGRARYCGKACQVRGWNEGGHRAECKIIKAIEAIWG
ncbi:zinc finger, mynd-type domain-containing protein [Podospora appendiculata]|uniref:Zinc finger, mynd-type domain-containing protein n=1 Tax=Podospora appendiculata TaxID=314037 RepID=A0AAE1CAS3_9PEZI|nr:zinc finger, mynd-type domain-containing protein [Podospora appendiculata]